MANYLDDRRERKAQRVDEALTSHVWTSTSAWSAHELRLLHVDIVYTDDILNQKIGSAAVENLQTILDAFQYDVHEWDNLSRTLDNFENDFIKVHGHLASEFYLAMCRVATTWNNVPEQESPLSVPAEQLQAYVEHTGPAMPSTSGTSSEESDNAQASSHSSKPRKAVSFSDNDASYESDSLRRSAAHGNFTKVRPAAARSIKESSSKEFVETGSYKSSEKFALAMLIKAVLFMGRLKNLDCSMDHAAYRVRFGAPPGNGPRSINDGGVILSRKLPKSNRVSIVNIKCTSPQGCTGPEAMSKIIAQEFGEMLAIVQERMNKTRHTSRRHVSICTVHTIAMHGQRAYLTLAQFKDDYLQGMEFENLGTERVIVKRTESIYALNSKEGLHDFIRVLYPLLYQLNEEIQCGRRY
ncbi:protein of unknown function [Taphrina deformans PYCC 5710]|uniref:Uncharacterized protein n=1 Tax=Taphrina deformans (strain PYCC 5710 / ATCC 11124 / CBS 356.35 / IMI 108563 / JCM 9778 / NBRC 8474) TaxID=1097556 RepID=R4XFR1_TAPDE|nr:protein of unknown function [Taphrina deformans PYCC 5710]|eukprot:CCG84696.1 protein of unknown function [Taphrina deformans PYCC 5710]